MKEVKPSRKPLAIYYAIVLLVLLVISNEKQAKSAASA